MPRNDNVEAYNAHSFSPNSRSNDGAWARDISSVVCEQLMNNLTNIKDGKEIENELKSEYLANYIKKNIAKTEYQEDNFITVISEGQGFCLELDKNCDTGEISLVLDHKAPIAAINLPQFFKIKVSGKNLEEESYLGTPKHPVKPSFTDSQIKWMEGLLSDTYNLVYQDEKTK